jgi:carboxyl-terminal processing protease
MIRNKKKRLVFLAFLLGGVLLIVVDSSRDGLAGSKYEELAIFNNVLSIVEKNYVEPVDDKKLIEGAIEGMLYSLDPHSNFLDAETFKEMQVETKGTFGGLGIEITIKDGYITIVSPIEGTPAYRVGLQSGDKIVKIEGKSTKNMTLIEAVRLMRGPKGTKITISVYREGFTQPEDYTITRDVIKVKSVRSKPLGDGYGYLKIVSFQEKTSQEVQKALKKLRDEGKLQGLVLDLRNNPGGLLDQAVEVSNLFLNGGLIVYTEGRVESQKMRFEATSKKHSEDYPIVALVNGGTASASEIVAGALQDHRRALILGTTTFGKGSVQTIIPLEGGAGLRLTTARYYTPKGRSIQAKGIEPDIVVREALRTNVEGAEKPEGFVLREENLEGHIENPGDETEAGKKEEREKQQKQEKQKERRERELLEPRSRYGDPKTDVQLARALELLKSWHVFEGLARNEAS